MLDRRTYRSSTGEEAHLSVETVTRPGGDAWWQIRLVRTDGSVAPVAGRPAVVWYRTREEAREAYRQRLRALRDAGWLRVG